MHIAHGQYFAVCDVLYQNKCVVHAAGGDWLCYTDPSNSITRSTVTDFNVEIGNVLKNVRKVVKIF